MAKRWIISEAAPQEAALRFPELHPVVLQLLWNRGFRTQEEVDVFWGPDWGRDTFSPSLFRNMKQAVERVFSSLEKGEVVTVHGDYDADGVCGSTVLVSTLRSLARAFGYDETKITYYIPHREKEGYGMSLSTVEYLDASHKTKLVITVDCGISNKPAIDRGKELGIDTIVCDHHTMPAELPEAAILIHPLVPGETYPNKHLCGTGVAFKLASALLEEAHVRKPELFPKGSEKWLLDLVAIATVTDVMPLTGENRVLETYGLLVLNKTRRPGLRALIDACGGKMGQLDTTSIGFQLGPRINAAGRMNHAHDALELLLEEDPTRAEELAQGLNKANSDRQRASEAMYLEARKQVGELGERKLIVAYAEGWSAGLVGLVAGKLVGEYGCPVIVAGQEGDKFVGSGRSIEGFNITSALHAASEHLDRFGGHPQACGFSTTSLERFQKASEAMSAFAREQLGETELVPTLKVDAEIQLEHVDWTLVDALDRFAPFGEANPRPVFIARGVRVMGMDTVGADGKHLRLSIQSKRGKLMKTIGFGFGSCITDLSLGAEIDVAFEVSVNQWNGNRELQLRLVDLVCHT